MKVEVLEDELSAYRVWRYPEVLIGAKVGSYHTVECLDLDEAVIREYAGHRAVYLEALAAFERAIEEARAAAQPPDVLAPEVE